MPCILLDKFRNMSFFYRRYNLKVIPTEIYSRVVGYYRPTSQWNKGKQAEFEDRKECNTKKTIEQVTV